MDRYRALYDALSLRQATLDDAHEMVQVATQAATEAVDRLRAWCIAEGNTLRQIDETCGVDHPTPVNTLAQYAQSRDDAYAEVQAKRLDIAQLKERVELMLEVRKYEDMSNKERGAVNYLRKITIPAETRRLEALLGRYCKTAHTAAFTQEHAELYNEFQRHMSARNQAERDFRNAMRFVPRDRLRLFRAYEDARESISPEALHR